MPSSPPHSHPESASVLLQQHAPKRVAVFRALQLGDMLCAVPALRALRAALPHARITLIGLPWAAQFAERFPAYVDAFAAFPGHPALPEQPVREDEIARFYAAMREQDFDLVIQLHGSGEISNGIVQEFGAKATAGFGKDDHRRGPHAWFAPYPDQGTEQERLLRLTEWLGAPAHGTHLEFPITEQDREELRQSGLIAGKAAIAQGNYICIHPGARIRDKCWPVARFAQVADRLAEEFGVTVVLTGSGKEVDLTTAVAQQMRMPAVNAAAPISIGAMAALMAGARLLVSNDTGVSHIAAGLRLPSVVIFSTADIRRWAPLDHDRHRSLWDPQGEQAEQVIEHARALLAGHQPPAKAA